MTPPESATPSPMAPPQSAMPSPMEPPPSSMPSPMAPPQSAMPSPTAPPPSSMPSPMAPPPSSMPLPVVNLILRIFAFLFLATSLIVMATNSYTVSDDYYEFKAQFDEVYAYRYMLSTSVIGMVYMLLQAAFAIYHVSMGKLLSSDLYTFDFYADKVISYLLATGAAATFGATVDWKRIEEDSVSSVDEFLNKANAAASLLLIAFICSAVSSVLSSLALSKKK